jgi:sigma-B regulation protein RsbU (phosphoserine phosphatase)
LFIAAVLYVSVTLYKYVTEWKKRLMLERELDIAKKIQESFLPKTLPQLSEMDIAAVMFTARQVGGDLYDFVEFQDGRIGIMIGDVSGKGVPASLFMAMVTGAFKTFALPESKPEEVLSNLNRKLMRESSSNLFVTVFYSIFDIKDKVMLYGNGGHLPVLHLPKEGALEFLDVEEGAPLGLMEGRYSGRQLKVSEGDIFVFYTDGLTEATNAKREMYEKDRLSAVVKENKRSPSKVILAAIEKDVRRFEPKAKQHDDITIIVVKII